MQSGTGRTDAVCPAAVVATGTSYRQNGSHRLPPPPPVSSATPEPLAAPGCLDYAYIVVDAQTSTEKAFLGRGPAVAALEALGVLSFPTGKLALPDLDASTKALLTWAASKRCPERKGALSLQGWGTKMIDQVVASAVACSLWNFDEMVVISHCCCHCSWLGQWKDVTCSLRGKSGMMAACHLVSLP